MIRAEKIKIEDLIEKNELIVPSYQRGYDWKKSEIEEFWEDLITHYEMKRKAKDKLSSEGLNLFLGTIILHKFSDNVFEIVDGQQRLTSIFLLLIAMRKKLDQWISDDVEVKGSNLKGVRQKFSEYISYTDPFTGNFEKTKLKASLRIANTIEYMSNDSWDGQFLSKYNDYNTKKEASIVKPLYTFLLNKLDEIKPAFFQYFMQAVLHTNIIKIEITEMEEAFTLFERTNARGKDLEASDLLKNHLFMNWEKKSLIDLEQEWEIITSNSRNQFIRMLKYFYVSQKGYITKSKLYKGFKDLAKGNVEKLLLNIKDFSNFYDIFNECDKEKINEFLKDIFKKNKGYSLEEAQFDMIRKSMIGLNYFRISQCLPLIYSFLCSFKILNLAEEKSFSKVPILFFRYLESYHFINNFICSRIGNEVEKLYAEYSEKFNSSKSSSEFILNYNNLFRALKDKIANKQEFEERFTSLNYKHEKNTDFMYIFDKIHNTNIKRETSPAYEFFNPKIPGLIKKYNIEHWYPQRPKENNNLLSDEYLHNIGNLLVIPKLTNKKLGNYSPKEKAETLKSETEFYSMPHINNFLNEYKDEFENWSQESIESRAKSLAHEAYAVVWQFNPPPIKI